MEEPVYVEVQATTVCRDCNQFVVFVGQTKCPRCGASPFHISSYQAQEVRREILPQVSR